MNDFDTSEIVEFYPDDNGNMEKPANERVSVKISPMTVRENRATKKLIRYKQVKGFRDTIVDNSSDVLDEIFCNRCLGFVNLICPVRGKPVKTVEEFNKSLCSEDLRMEVIDKIQKVSALRPEQRKNSAPPSDG